MNPNTKKNDLTRDGIFAARAERDSQNRLRFGGVTPAGSRVAPVDWRAAVSTNTRGKSCQGEAGKEVAREKSGRTRGVAEVKTRLSLAVA